MVVVKCCSGCGVVKSLEDFHRRRASADGRESRCKECKSAYNRRYREENRDKVREYQHRYREENREYVNRRDSRYRNSRQSVTKSAATKRGPWSEAEIAILMADDGRTLVAKALELGRAYNSCESKRRKLHRCGATN